MSKPIALVLGGTNPHVVLCQKLKDRGYHVILIDYLDNPPARQYADEHIKESTLDKEKVLEIAKNRKASLVISTCVDQANSVCCYVAEKLNLPHPYSYQTSLDVTDKVRMKEILVNHGIPTPRHIYVKSFDEVCENKLRYPLMVKPADSNSANGVKKVSNELELKQFLPHALEFSRNGFAIIEEFLEGVEISAYCIVTSTGAKLLMAQERISVIEGESNTIKCYSAFAPARISEEANAKIEDLAYNIAKAFNLENTPLFFQGIVRESDIEIIEFAPRVGGGISSQTIKHSTGFDLIESAIDSFLGNSLDINIWHPMNKYYAVNQLYGSNGVYSHTEGGESLLEDGTIDILAFYKKPGSNIDSSRASSGRIGVMVVSAETESGIKEKINKAFNIIDCFDVDGKSILRKDLNLAQRWDSINITK